MMPPRPVQTESARFRTRLLIAMMLVVTLVTTLAIFFAQREIAEITRWGIEREFQGELASFQSIQNFRRAALAERCRALARRPRIHAALEDNALDLLYPSARDELLELMDGVETSARNPGAGIYRARFYRFLDARGAVISPSDTRDVGQLHPAEEAELSLGALPDEPQSGYLRRNADGTGETVDEVLAMPIISSETGRPIAALALGFPLAVQPDRRAATGMISGIWTQDWMYLPAVSERARLALADRISRELAGTGQAVHGLAVDVDGIPGLLFCRHINLESTFTPAYEVCIYPLTDSLARQRRLFWQFTGTGVLLLGGAFVASQFLSRRLSWPVEKLAVESEENRHLRHQAEAALELTHEELQRAARFSADASHQLKTPVTVLRAGLEELLAGESLTPEVQDAVSSLVHQTFRLTSIIEDLLLLSRMDAGRLRLNLGPVNLTRLLEAWLDDLAVLPDPFNLAVETDIPPAVLVDGEKPYTAIILQNLLENARKFNRPGGSVRITLRHETDWVVLNIANSGPGIPATARDHLFQRFHRGAIGENLPGHGLGLNLARELARLHRGDLLFVRSDTEWTEFEVRFRPADPISNPASSST